MTFASSAPHRTAPQPAALCIYSSYPILSYIQYYIVFLICSHDHDSEKRRKKRKKENPSNNNNKPILL